MIQFPYWLRSWLSTLNWYIQIPPWNVWLFSWHIANVGDWWSFGLYPGAWVTIAIEHMIAAANSILWWLKSLLDNVDGWVHWLLDRIYEVSQSIVNLWDAIWATVTLTWQNIWDWWAGRWGEIAAWVNAQLGGLTNWWNGLLNDVRNWVNTRILDITNWWNSLLDGIRSWVSGLINDTRGWVNQRITDTTTWWNQTTAPLFNFYNTYKNHLGSFFNNPFEYLMNVLVVPAAAAFAGGFETGMQTDAPPAPPGNGAGPSPIISYAMQFIGRPYVWGGNGPDVFDCSGYAKYVWEHFGKTLPRTAQQQFNASWPATPNQPGDLVFFQFEDEIDHVGMYTGTGDTMIHASSRNGYVKIDTITALGWWSFYKGTRRPM